MKRVTLAVRYAKRWLLITIRPASRSLVEWEGRSHTFLHY